MAALTCTQATDIFQYVLKTVMQLQETDPLYISMQQNGVTNIFDLVSINTSEINMFTYKDDAGTVHPLKRGDIGLFRAFIGFILYRANTGNPINDADWLNVTVGEFNAFRISPDFIASNSGMTTTAPATRMANPTSVPTPRVKDPVMEFKRGIKRDITYFTPLKDEKQWDTWQCTTVAQAHAQDISEVLDPTYTPITVEEMELFDEKQKYMFAAFERNLLTDQGKAFVRDYAQTYDAQAIYKDLCAYALQSTKASLDSSAILSYLTSVRCGDGSWRGTTHAFILHWQDQVRKYETLVPPSDHFSDGQKRSMLENAVHPQPELRAVKNQANQHKTQTGLDLTYKQYSNILLSAASQFDAQFTAKSTAARLSAKHCSIYEHDITADVDGDTFFDIDSDLETIQAFNSMTKAPPPTYNSYPRLTSNQWHRLSPDAQTNWDKFTQAEKGVILEMQPLPAPN
jgi:hypothetical protein